MDIHPSPTGLMRYDQARQMIAQCARIDDAADIRDKAAALAAYARQRDDHEMQAWVKEIHLRACVRIGELSRELETAERSRTDLHPAARTQTKTAALAEAGISTSTAHEYEQLAGGREDQAHAAIKAGTEAFFATTKAAGEVPTLAGLKAAVREAVVATLGPPPARPTRAAPVVDERYNPWSDWAAAVEHLATADADLPALAAYRPHYRQELLDFAATAIERLESWRAVLLETPESNEDAV